MVNLRSILFLYYVIPLNSSCIYLCKDILNSVNNNHNILKTIETKINYLINKNSYENIKRSPDKIYNNLNIEILFLLFLLFSSIKFAYNFNYKKHYIKL